MQKKSPTHKINTQLQKLNQIMQQQLQFNRKYILKALESTGSTNSIQEQDIRLQNNQTISQNQRHYKFANTNQLSIQLLTTLQPTEFVQYDRIQKKTYPITIQNNQAKVWLKETKAITCDPFQVNLDQQSTTKSISYSYQHQSKFQFHSRIKQDFIEDEDKLTVVKNSCGDDRGQLSNVLNRTQKLKKDKYSHISDSAVATTQMIEGSFHKHVDSSSKNGKQIIKLSNNTIQSNKKMFTKEKEYQKLIQQQKRPLTSIKTTNKKILKEDKQDRWHLNNLKKLKQQSLFSKQKKLSNRNTKTQRQKIQIETISHLLKNQSTSNLQQNKNISINNVLNKPKIQRKIVNQQSKNITNKFTSQSQTWQKSQQKPTKKLNKINLNKLNDNLKQQGKQRLPEKNLSQLMGAFQKDQLPNNKNNQHKILVTKYCHGSSNDNKQFKFNDFSKNIEKQRQQNNLKFKQEKHIVQRLDFNNKIPIMQRMIERKNIFKHYNLMSNNYIQAAKRINTKYLKDLQLEIKQIEDEGILKLKIISAVIAFFSQFFRPTKKNIMGMIARCTQDQEIMSLWEDKMGTADIVQKQIWKKKQIEMRKTKLNENCKVSKQTLIVSLLQKSKDLVNIIQTLPSHLYNCNLLSQMSVKNLLNQYDKINQKIDQNGDLQLFLLKKTKIFVYFHELVQFIKFLQHYDLIQQTQRKNLNINKNMIAGYYSSRNRRQDRNKNGNVHKKQNKGCDSQRKITVQGIQTDRIFIPQDKTKYLSCIKTKKQLKQQKQQKFSMQKQSRMLKSRDRKFQ